MGTEIALCRAMFETFRSEMSAALADLNVFRDCASPLDGKAGLVRFGKEHRIFLQALASFESRPRQARAATRSRHQDAT